MSVCLFGWEYVRVNIGDCVVQKRVLALLALELQAVVVSCQPWVLESKLRSSARGVHVLYCRTTCLFHSFQNNYMVALTWLHTSFLISSPVMNM